MKVKKYYYKVVRNVDGCYLASIFKHRYSLVYVPGKWTEPEIGKIYIFEKIEDARTFGFSFPTEIWKVEAKGVQLAMFCLVPDFLNREEYVEEFWNSKKLLLGKSTSVPLGSFVAKKVKLIERVE